MNNGNKGPFRQPQQQKVMFQYDEATPRACLKCGELYFISTVKIGVIPSTHPRNPTGKEVELPFNVYICRACGHEHGQSVFQDGKAE